ncbi:MAG: cytochrome c3 family protein [Acidobacteriota bacterium]
MIRNGSPQRMLSRIVCCLWLCLAGGAVIGIETPATAQSDDKCIACHSRQKERAGQVVSIYQTSTHGKMNIGCEGCHGGDASQAEKLRAHAGRFIARPDASATLEMCGRCHRQPLEFFKSSRHFAARPNVRRLDCVECHGVHGIGAASESFRWPQFCAGCHGLEYLPQLPRPFQEMLALADDLGDGLHRLETKGRANTELIQRRKEIRHMISELVHQTDARGGMERIPRILELGATLKQRIASEEKR